MSDFQKTLFRQTAEAIRPKSWKAFVIKAAISSALVILLVFALTGNISWWLSLGIVAITLVYNYARDIVLRLLAMRQMNSQFAYSFEKHPDISDYVPVFDTTSGVLQLKFAAIIFRKNDCGLITFKQPAFAKNPKDSIVVPIGNDFSIDSLRVVTGKPYVILSATLMRTPFFFGVYKNEIILTKIESIIDSNSKEV
jgi:hypothetical protein